MSNKYRKDSIRLQHWDYGWNAAYFVTICSKNKICYFGNIIDGEMHLSATGKIVNDLWYDITNHTKNVELGQFVVMPNHIHGIIIINTDPVEARPALSNVGRNRFQNQGKNTLSSIIGGYKSAVTKNANLLMFQHAWQPRFYEHIIRNQKSLNEIESYIINNPINWRDDKLYKE